VTRSATFNAIHPTIDTSPNFLLLAAGTSMRTDVLGDGGSLLVLYYGNVAGPAQSKIVQFGEHGDFEGRGHERGRSPSGNQWPGGARPVASGCGHQPPALSI
jgi:hypothetical protein